jgi:hypothetical protein
VANVTTAAKSKPLVKSAIATRKARALKYNASNGLATRSTTTTRNSRALKYVIRNRLLAKSAIAAGKARALKYNARNGLAIRSTTTTRKARALKSGLFTSKQVAFAENVPRSKLITRSTIATRKGA